MPDDIGLMIAVIAFSALIIFGPIALYWRRNGRYIRGRTRGPGWVRVPAPTDPWRRFSRALGAMYTRNEWNVKRIRGPRTRQSPEQMYFGYGSVLPVDKLREALAQSWGIAGPDHAARIIHDGVQLATVEARAVSLVRGETDDALTSKLIRANVPTHAIDALLHTRFDGIDSARHYADRPRLAFDIARMDDLVRWCANLGMISADDANRDSDRLGAAAVACFDSWDEYGREFVEGLAWRGPGVSEPIVLAARWLLTSEKSPWATQPWP